MQYLNKILIQALITLCINTALHAGSTYIQSKTNLEDSLKNITQAEFHEKLTLAKELTQLYKMDSAIIVYKHLYHIDTTQISIVKEIASLYTKTAQYEKALQSVHEILKHEPNNRFYFIQKGILLKKINENDSALAIFKTALTADSSNTFMLNHIGDIFRELNQVDSAVYYYSKVCDINPITSSLIKSVDILHKNNKNKEALSFLNKYYIEENHQSKVLKRLNGKTLYINDSIYNAYSVFIDLYKNGDSSKVTTKYLGLCCWKNAYYPKGEEALRNYIGKDSTDFLAYYVLGICCKHNKKIEESQLFLARSLALYQPDVKTENLIYKGIAEVHELKEQYKKAIEYYQLIAKNDPKNIYAEYKIATIYDFDLVNTQKALQCYTDLKRKIKNSDSPESEVFKNYCEIRIEQINETEFWKQKN